jgi:hypothetical protein
MRLSSNKFSLTAPRARSFEIAARNLESVNKTAVCLLFEVTFWQRVSRAVEFNWFGRIILKLSSNRNRDVMENYILKRLKKYSNEQRTVKLSYSRNFNRNIFRKHSKYFDFRDY